VDSRAGGVREAGGGGGTGGGTGSAPVVGTWRNVRVVLEAGTRDTIITETRWTFNAGGACSKTVAQTRVSTGTQITFPRDTCTYTFTGSSVTVLFAGSSVPTTFSVTFANGTLLLDGFPFSRI
jgi:hypothetical protein